jgi:hypothetical protein
MTRPTTRLLHDVLDMGVYRGHSQHPGNMSPFRKTQSIPLITFYKTRVLRSLVVLLVLLHMATPMSSYAAEYSKDQLRLYTHSRVLKFNEFICIDKIIIRESNYNYLARNGSHFGIGQMRSQHYQSKDPYTQIDLTIAYTLKRYKSLCNGYAFHLKHGYY